MTVELNVWMGNDSRAWTNFCIKNISSAEATKEHLDAKLQPYNGWFEYKEKSGSVLFKTEQDKAFFLLKWV